MRENGGGERDAKHLFGGLGHGEGGSKRLLAGIIFASGMAVLAVNFLNWLFGL